MKLSRAFTDAAIRNSVPDNLASALATILTASEELFLLLRSSEKGRYEDLSSSNPTGDKQTLQDTEANRVFLDATKTDGHFCSFLSEEVGDLLEIGAGSLTIAIDPFDGSKAFRFGIPAGTIFAIYDNNMGLAPLHGRSVVASGVILYGIRHEAIIACQGIVYLLDNVGWRVITSLGRDDRFICVNISNRGRWSPGWRKFFDDRLSGAGDSNDHNMRWFGSLATHIKTMVLSGGLFAYPPDSRGGYASGHLRLYYEAIPTAHLIETLGGASSDGVVGILEKHEMSHHARTALILGEQSLVSDLTASIAQNRQKKI